MKVEQAQGRKTWKVVIVSFVVGVAVMTAVAATYSYIDSPQFCGSCHAMTDHYASWQMATHSTVACSECHLPNDNFAHKLVSKAQTGIVDLYHQVMRDYPLEIEITDQGKVWLQENCIRCHEPAVANVSLISEGKDCTSCHRDLVHS